MAREDDGYGEGLRSAMECSIRDLLVHQLTHKFGPIPRDVFPRLASAPLETYLCWVDRVIEARTLEEVLGGSRGT